MSNFYVACDLGAETGRVMLGILNRDELTISEVRRFKNLPLQEKDTLQWNIPHLYQEILDGLRSVGGYEEQIESIGCTSWAGDYLLFDSDGSLITPSYQGDACSEGELKKIFSKVPWETIYGETGVQQRPANTLLQLRAEKSRRLSKASHLMPIADAFNFLLAGVPRVEMTSASATQLFNPVTSMWSERLFTGLNLPRKLFPPLVTAGTDLGALRPEIVAQTGLDGARVVTSCSHQMAAALAGFPVRPGESWGFLQMGSTATMGVELERPLLTEGARELKFTNETGYNGSVRFSKPTSGLWVLDECRRFWESREKGLEGELLTHLASSAPPFESLINLSDPRFSEPGDMPLKVQAFCKETHQPIPRKPGPITRCILESLALLYRKTLREIEGLTGREVTRIYLLGGTANVLLNYFTANALQIPVMVMPPQAVSIGNIMIQALASRRVQTMEQAREIARTSFKMETIIPHANAWNTAYDRLTHFFC